MLQLRKARHRLPEAEVEHIRAQFHSTEVRISSLFGRKRIPAINHLRELSQKGRACGSLLQLKESPDIVSQRDLFLRTADVQAEMALPVLQRGFIMESSWESLVGKTGKCSH